MKNYKLACLAILKFAYTGFSGFSGFGLGGISTHYLNEKGKYYCNCKV